VPFERRDLLPESPAAAAGRPFGEVRLLLIAGAINAALFAAVLATLALGYETNDDVGMAQIASGLMTGKPSAELIFTNLLIGEALKQLYQLTDRVNWYTLYLLIAHFAAMTGLLFAFLRIRSSWTSVALFVLLFVQYELALLLWLNFTSVAVTAAIVGSLLLTSCPPTAVGRRSLSACYGGSLIVVAGLIRADSLFYGMLVVAPFLAYRLLCLRRWRPVLWMGVTLAVAIAAIAVNGWHYRSDPGWRDYSVAVAGLTPVLESQAIEYNEHTRPFFDSVGWSATDWRMMRSNFFADPGVFSTERMRKMSSYFREQGWRRPHPWTYLENQLSPVIVFERMTYANMLLAFLLCGGRRLRLVLLGGFQGLWVLAVLLLLASYFKIQPRVAMPVAFGLGVIVFDLALQTMQGRSSLPENRPRSRWVLAVGVLAVSFVYCWAFYRTASRNWAVSEFNRRSHAAFRSLVQNVIERYVENDPDAIFFNWGASFPYQLTPPFDTIRQAKRLRIVPLGWNQLSPLFDQRLRQLGFHDMRDAVLDNPHVYFFMAPARIEVLKQFVKEHYHEDIVPKRVDVLPVGGEEDADRDDSKVYVVQMTTLRKSPTRL